ncbi:MAG: hypothetical protein DWP98_10715 [Bacteroidetes bacterium]|nr:MAG: hypothetical protein DWP98_10715 [Bacteroidota bacterium]MBL1143325.1 hypothetical protein [Bacteroidota bacterium]MCB0801618.1 hypothetical protein [Flavobacteriales bacterium]NOG56127.1 hypothetical protein [Bacteroidota bacterium]
MKKLIPFIIVAFFIVLSLDVEAQCSMCKAVLESNMQNGEDAVGKGINSGIIYIMFVPYILMATVGYFLYKHHIKNKDRSLN